MNIPLTKQEASELAACEKVIRAGMGSFADVGLALLKIRNERLYRQTHSSFAIYLEEVYAISRQRAHQMIEAAQVVDQLSKNFDTSNVVPLPKTESVARELAKLPEEKREEVWKDAVEQSGGEQPTAKKIQEAAKAEETKIVSKGLTRISQQKLLDVITNSICKYEEAFPCAESYELLLADLEAHRERITDHLKMLQTKAA